ncbi:MAG: glycoside hydrolase family 32 protein [Bacteroidia bacterium]|nr:MAG: glycoside hydrolase family 32 protein [Bacteroidia bacterium]
MKIQRYLISFLITLTFLFSSCTRQKSGESGTSETRYTEQHRPQFHFSPDSMWMNDPNGMVYYQGEYHLFYQHNPNSNVWGPMHWGHAISTDLVHWEHLPIALYPDSLGTIFSGSAVMDWNNSSGLGNGDEPPMVAIFTHHNHELENQESLQFQYQSIAYSLDKGRNWTKYPGNPVLDNPGIRDFRDPKVIWMEEADKWIMVLAAHDRVLFYSSPDLISWTMESEFGENIGAHGGVWECPDLFPLEAEEEQKWVLLVSINPGGPNGGSATQYFVGEFDGKNFHNENPGEEPLWLDYGKDNYAGVTWSDIPKQDGRRIFMGWMSNWQYANQVPTVRWRNAMTLPRELKLGKDDFGYMLRSVPVVETEKLRVGQIKLESGPVQGRNNVGPANKEADPLYEIDLLFEFDPEVAEEIEFGFVLESTQHEKVVAGYNTRSQELFIGRKQNSGNTDFSEHFPGVHSAPNQISELGEIRFHAFVDLSSIELFVDEGAVVLTELVFPESGFESIRLYGVHESVKLKEGVIYSLESTW